MHKTSYYSVGKIALLGVLLGLGQSAWAGLEVQSGVLEGAADPWDHQATFTGPIATATSVDGPGWVSLDAHGGTANFSSAVVDYFPTGSDWIKYLDNPFSADPGAAQTLYEGITFEDTLGDDPGNIVGYSMTVLTAGWEFVDGSGLVGNTVTNNTDGASGTRTAANTIYDFVFTTSLGPGANFRIAVDLVWTGSGAFNTDDIQVLQTACFDLQDCTASTGQEPPPQGETPIPGTPALLAIGLIGLGLRRRARG